MAAPRKPASARPAARGGVKTAARRKAVRPKAVSRKKTRARKATRPPKRVKPAARKTTSVKAARARTKKPVDGTKDVDEYLRKLKHPLKAEMEAVRSIIRHANGKLAERIKWNAPSFYYRADMAAFNPRATGFVQVIFVFPKGMVVQDEPGLLHGLWKDRREARFYDMNDVLSKRSALERVVNEWVALVDAGVES